MNDFDNDKWDTNYKVVALRIIVIVKKTYYKCNDTCENVHQST